MIKAKITKNGMINIPAELRKKLKIKAGDTISFVETPEGMMIVPIKNIFELTDPKEYQIAKEIIREITKDRKEETWK
ncbi:MAG: AbrB/MazE/SpoVT family DNA-binding domain-containing protein [Candidatus Hodarchaeales archaeon]|jgi:AbrB family looped-hinge helix DNA binding protein